MATSDDHDGFARAETAFKDFISSPENLTNVRQALAQLAELPDSEEQQRLQQGFTGWLAVFESNIIDSDAARDNMRELIAMESALFAKRQQLVLKHQTEQGREEEATLSMLATNLATNQNEAGRKSSHDAFLGLEQWVLANGFLDIVKQRNAFARQLGYRDYFDYKVQKNEHMTPEALFVILDEFEAQTRDANQRALQQLAQQAGPQALEPWNIRFYMSGDVIRQMDAYLPFSKAVERWVGSFRRLGITYRQAVMQLDLLERKGKYQNGFCHGPTPAFYDEGRWVPAHINFTSDAKPDQVGSGQRAITTLFHEGGHAAHFANVTQQSPCFSQEFAPTSMAYAETQSMFCDSLLGDADWLKRYAKNALGDVIPDELIKAQIEVNQPFRAFMERMILYVPYFERALYQLADEDLQADKVVQLARDTEQRILGIRISSRPVLAIPHLLNQESAAAYHGYLLAHMAVYQTRAYFLKKDGYLTDNPAIGPALAQHYWAPGNSISHNDTLVSLTGEPFNPAYLARACNLTVEQAWQEARAQMNGAASRAYPAEYPATLEATIRLVHGNELIADNSVGEGEMSKQFERWVAQHYPAGQAAA